MHFILRPEILQARYCFAPRSQQRYDLTGAEQFSVLENHLDGVGLDALQSTLCIVFEAGDSNRERTVSINLALRQDESIWNCTLFMRKCLKVLAKGYPCRHQLCIRSYIWFARTIDMD